MVIPHPLRGPLSTHWKQLFSCGSSSDWIKLLNFDRFTVLKIFLPRFNEVRKTVNFYSPYRRGPKVRGRRPMLDTTDILGLKLRYLKSCGKQYYLCGMFGLVETIVSVWKDYGFNLLLNTLRNKGVPQFCVSWPSVAEMDDSYQLLKKNRENVHLLPDVFCVIHGGRMPCADYEDKDLQNAFYEGYTGNLEVTNIFVFNFRGEIIHSGVKFPGSWHGSKVVLESCLLIYKLSDERTPRGKAILGDSDFIINSRVVHGKITRGRKSTETIDIPMFPLLAAVEAILQRSIPSELQSAEWGIRVIKAPFGRLRIPLPASSTLSYRLLNVCVHLYNLNERKI